MQTFPQRWAACVLALTVWPAIAADGLRLPGDGAHWPRWQARVGLTTASLVDGLEFPSARGLHLQSAQVLGDYYFTGPAFGAGRLSGGFRATTGLMLGPSTTGLSSAPALGSGLSLTVSRRHATDPGDPVGAVPYLGLGYTGLSARGGWGFSADLGLIGSARGQGLQLNRAGPSLDDVLRDMRLTPVLQLGVSYSF